MANAQHVGHYQFSIEDQLFFNTNIWISLFNCRSDPKKQENESLVKIHAGALKRAKKAGSQLFTHPIVAAEFVNRMLRDEHNFLHSLNEAPKNFKAWRRSASSQSFCRNCRCSNARFHSKLSLR